MPTYTFDLTTEVTHNGTRESGADVTSDMVDGDLVVSGSGISAKFKGGTDGHVYICEIVAKTSEGGSYEGEFGIMVSALP